MPYIDLHCDMLSRLYRREPGNETENCWENQGQVDLTRLRGAGCLAQFFACFLDTSRKPVSGSHYTDALGMIRLLKSDLRARPGARLALSYDTYRSNREAGLLSCLLTVEEGGILEQDLSRLETFYEEGIRLITLTWNHENGIGCPHTRSGPGDRGLTPFGVEVVREMERLGMLVDVSHLSDAGFQDVCRYTRKPFLASHSCCRSLCGHSRNLTDEMIRQIAQRQGVIGVNFFGAFLREDRASTVDAILCHLRHLIRVGGIEVAALGSDFDGISGPLELHGCQDMPRLTDALEQAGFSSAQIDALCVRNAERMLQLL